MEADIGPKKADSPFDPDIAVLMIGAWDDPEMLARLAAFRQGLSRLGWAEGTNVSIDTRFADGKADQFSTLAKELVAPRPDVIVAQAGSKSRNVAGP